jgi:hypothetical protein
VPRRRVPTSDAPAAAVTLFRRGLTLEQAKEAFEKYQSDHEVQMVLTTMYQTKLDQNNVNPDLTIEKYCDLTQVQG